MSKNFSELEKPYAALYEGNFTSNDHYTNVVSHYLLELFPNLESVIDVGCGAGRFLHGMKSLGKNILGLDCNAYAGSVLGENEYIKCDLLEALPQQSAKFDLCVCTEVAEHLPGSRAEGFVRELCAYSDVVLFGAATAYQFGPGHLFMKMPSYWISVFEKNGYQPFDVLRPIIWNEAQINPWHRQNPLLYIHKDRQEEITRFNEIRAKMPPIYDVVHPAMFSMVQEKRLKEKAAFKALDEQFKLEQNRTRTLTAQHKELTQNLQAAQAERDKETKIFQMAQVAFCDKLLAQRHDNASPPPVVFPNTVQRVLMAFYKPILKCFAQPETYIRFRDDPENFFVQADSAANRAVKKILARVGPEPDGRKGPK